MDGAQNNSSTSNQIKSFNGLTLLIMSGSLKVSQYQASVFPKAEGINFEGTMTWRSIIAVAGLKKSKYTLTYFSLEHQNLIRNRSKLNTNMWLRKYPVKMAFRRFDIFFLSKPRSRTTPTIRWSDVFRLGSCSVVNRLTVLAGNLLRYQWSSAFDSKNKVGPSHCQNEN